MSRDTGGGASSILMTFVLGALSGAAIAVLLSPGTGDRTRKFVNARAREGRKLAEEAARQGREFVGEQRDAFEQAFERGREAYQQAREQEDA